ncbi:MAG: hypothetical protein DMG07_25800 [Acidobacteria bacterium]|nr:MAG: hypothetical protein DMG07_25800 [Acidobacteriota bacterium]
MIGMFDTLLRDLRSAGSAEADTVPMFGVMGRLETSIPSVSSSPCSLGAPQSTFEALMSRISSRISFIVPGLPTRPRRLFHFQ